MLPIPIQLSHLFAKRQLYRLANLRVTLCIQYVIITPSTVIYSYARVHIHMQQHDAL